MALSSSPHEVYLLGFYSMVTMPVFVLPTSSPKPPKHRLDGVVLGHKMARNPGGGRIFFTAVN
jgi:hypothetical protein